MSFKLDVTQKLGYLHVIVTGENSKIDTLAYLEQLRVECASRNVWYVLLEERLAGPRLKLRDVLDIMFRVRRGPSRAPTIAYVHVNARGYSMRIAEFIATLRGFHVWMFKSVEEAERRLREY